MSQAARPSLRRRQTCAQKSLINPFDNARRPARETLVALRETLERRLLGLAAPELQAEASIGH